jgi:LL-diaminopimelate aminotransferase
VAAHLRDGAPACREAGLMTNNHKEPAARMAALPPNFFHGLNQKLARLKAEGRDVIRMDMGSPDLPPAPFIIEALRRSAEAPDHHGYQPFGGIEAYRAAWAEFYGRRFGVELDPDREVMGLIGSKSGIFQLALAFVNPGDCVLIPDPGYATYTAGARFAGGEIQYLPLTAQNHFLPDLRALLPETLRGARLMWLNYPNNPTGVVAPLEFFGEAVRLAREYGFLLAHDAPYTEITYDGYRAPSLLQVPGAKDVAVEFHSLSKTANMGGWRAGVVCGNPSVLRAISAMQSSSESGHFRPVLDAAIAALRGDNDWQAARNEIYRERRDLVVAGVRAAGLQADTPSAAIYVWARLPEGAADDAAYADALLETAGVSATPGRIFGPSGRGYLRVSLGTPTMRVREAMERWAQWAQHQPAPHR